MQFWSSFLLFENHVFLGKCLLTGTGNVQSWGGCRWGEWKREGKPLLPRSWRATCARPGSPRQTRMPGCAVATTEHRWPFCSAPVMPARWARGRSVQRAGRGPALQSVLLRAQRGGRSHSSPRQTSRRSCGQRSSAHFQEQVLSFYFVRVFA